MPNDMGVIATDAGHASMSVPEMAAEVAGFAPLLSQLAHPAEEPFHIKFSPESEKYFGDYRQHSSFFVSSDAPSEHLKPVANNELRPFMKILGVMHEVYRTLIPKDLPKLKIMELKGPGFADLRPILDEFDRILAQYSLLVERTRRNPHGPFDWNDLPDLAKIPRQDWSAIQQKSIDVAQKLLAARTPFNHIPVSVGDTTEWLENEVQDGVSLAAYLLALEQTSKHHFNRFKVPEELEKRFLTKVAGRAEQGVARTRQRFEQIPILMEAWEMAHAKYYPKIIAAIRENAHALQMAWLVCAPRITNEVGEHGNPFHTGCAALLAKAGYIHPQPEQLETPIECAIVLQSIVRDRGNLKQDAAVTDLINQCIELDHHQRERIDSGLMNRVRPVLVSLMEEPSSAASTIALRATLAQDFLTRQRTPDRGDRDDRSAAAQR